MQYAYTILLHNRWTIVRSLAASRLDEILPTPICCESTLTAKPSQTCCTLYSSILFRYRGLPLYQPFVSLLVTFSTEEPLALLKLDQSSWYLCTTVMVNSASSARVSLQSSHQPALDVVASSYHSCSSIPMFT